MNECTTECQSRDSIISSAGGHMGSGAFLIDTKRFCYLECKPDCNAKKGDMCGPLSPDEVDDAKSLDGNGKPVKDYDCSEAITRRYDKAVGAIDAHGAID
jgi:hypothetical protein